MQELRNYTHQLRKRQKIKEMEGKIRAKFPEAKFTVRLYRGKFTITGLSEEQIKSLNI